MKNIIYFFFPAMLLSLSVSAQHVIKANHISNHIGEKVVVVDSIYDVKVYNDSTAVLDLGAKGDKAMLTVAFRFDSKSKFNPELLKSCNESLIEVTGFVVSVAGQPSIVVTDKKNLYFFSKSIYPTGPVFTQVSYKKH